MRTHALTHHSQWGDHAWGQLNCGSFLVRKAFKEGLNVKPKDEHQLWCSNPRHQGRGDVLGGNSICRADNVSSASLQPVPSNGREVWPHRGPASQSIDSNTSLLESIIHFSVPLTGFYSLAQSKWSCNQGLCHSPIFACKCCSLGTTHQPSVCSEREFLQKQKEKKTSKES